MTKEIVWSDLIRGFLENQDLLRSVLVDALRLSTLRLVTLKTFAFICVMHRDVRMPRSVGCAVAAHLRFLVLLPVLLVMPIQVVNAAGLFDFAEHPEGETEQPPASLSSYPIGENTEQHLPPDEIFTLWIQDEAFYRPQGEDRVEMQKVLEKEVKTHKLENVVKPIGFASGDAEIPVEFVTQLRNILNGMKKSRQDVMSHFITLSYIHS